MKKILVSLLFSFIYLEYTFAQNVTVNIKTSIEPISALGLVISNSRTLEKNDTKFTRDSTGNVVVEFTLDQNEISPGTLITAFVKDKAGAIAFGELKNINQNTDTQDIPACKLKIPNNLSTINDLGVLQSLVQKRIERREIALNKSKIILTPQIISKLTKLEDGFGIIYKDSFNLDGNPYETINRLSRLIAAISSHKASSEIRAKNEKYQGTSKK